MVETIKATARIESDGSAILVFHDVTRDGKAEAYSRTDGHVMVTRGYYTTRTKRPRGPDDEAQVSRLVEHYNRAIKGATLALSARMDWRTEA